MPSPSRPVERARPLLGTVVAIRAGGLPDAQAHAAVDRAFARVAHVHGRMSYFDPGSDVSRLNRAMPGERIAVDPETAAVLALALSLAEASGGVFDPTVAGELVREGRLPAPGGARPPDPKARFDDIVLDEGAAVRLRRPLWLDLGGIAKGHAVDRAVDGLVAEGAVDVCAEAGGDLRVTGEACAVPLRTGFCDETVALIHLADGSLAGSGGRGDSRHAADGTHRDGARRRPVLAGRFACVVAERCAVADALTKVVLSLGAASEAVLARFGAAAHLREPDGHWQALGGAAS